MQILIGAISVAILLFGNFIISLPILCYNDKIFSRLVNILTNYTVKFALMTFVFAVVFFIYGGLILKGRTIVYEYIDTECQKPLGFFGDYDRIHTIASTFACTAQCPCQASQNYSLISLGINDFPSTLQASMVTSPTGITNITQCDGYNKYAESEALNLDKTLNIIEKYFNCSGICYKYDFFFYTNFSLYHTQQS